MPAFHLDNKHYLQTTVSFSNCEGSWDYAGQTAKLDTEYLGKLEDYRGMNS